MVRGLFTRLLPSDDMLREEEGEVFIILPGIPIICPGLPFAIKKDINKNLFMQTKESHINKTDCSVEKRMNGPKPQYQSISEVYESGSLLVHWYKDSTYAAGFTSITQTIFLKSMAKS